MCFWFDEHHGVCKQTRISNIVNALRCKPGALKREIEASFTAKDAGSKTQDTNAIGVSVGAMRVQSVLEGPAEEGRTYSGNQLQTGHSLEVYEGKCSRGQLV